MHLMFVRSLSDLIRNNLFRKKLKNNQINISNKLYLSLICRISVESLQKTRINAP